MEQCGFIHDILDVKVLILYVMTQVEAPVTAQTIFELCYQDDGLSYFDVRSSIPQMVESGHLEPADDEKYILTPKGRETADITSDSIAFAVRERAREAAARYNRDQRRFRYMQTDITQSENGEYTVRMALDDPTGPLMDLYLTAPTKRQARRLEASYRRCAEIVYRSIMMSLLEEIPQDEDT